GFVVVIFCGRGRESSFIITDLKTLVSILGYLSRMSQIANEQATSKISIFAK
ncbi:MAG: hypothetical protein MHPSP_003252, partial [Paramarteilia canceri]